MILPSQDDLVCWQRGLRSYMNLAHLNLDRADWKRVEMFLQFALQTAQAIRRTQQGEDDGPNGNIKASEGT